MAKKEKDKADREKQKTQQEERKKKAQARAPINLLHFCTRICSPFFIGINFKMGGRGVISADFIRRKKGKENSKREKK